jgi:hypothetical protein
MTQPASPVPARQAPVAAGWFTVTLTLVIPFLLPVALIMGGIVAGRGRAGHGIAIMTVAILVCSVRLYLFMGS